VQYNYCDVVEIVVEYVHTLHTLGYVRMLEKCMSLFNVSEGKMPALQDEEGRNALMVAADAEAVSEVLAGGGLIVALREL
jgi:hypothetical protein